MNISNEYFNALFDGEVDRDFHFSVERKTQSHPACHPSTMRRKIALSAQCSLSSAEQVIHSLSLSVGQELNFSVLIRKVGEVALGDFVLPDNVS